MPNIIEIVVRGRNEFGSTAAEVKAEAEALGRDAGTSMSDGITQGAEAGKGDIEAVGREAGQSFTSGLSKEVDAGRGELDSKLSAWADDFLSQGGVFGDNMLHGLTSEADQAGHQFTATFSKAAQDGLMVANVLGFLEPASSPGGQAAAFEDALRASEPDMTRKAQSQSEAIAAWAASSYGDTYRAMMAEESPAMGDALGQALGDSAKAPANNAGKQTGNVLMKAIGDAAILGAPLVVGAALAGLPVALDLASTEMQKLTGKSLDLGAAAQITAAQTAELKANVLTAGTDALPGMALAMGRDTPIVTAMGQAIETMATGVGKGFANISVNAQQTAEGVAATGRIFGTAFSTIGTVVGNLASTAGPALTSVAGGVDGVLSAVGRMTSVPGVMGAATGAFAAWQVDGPLSKGLQGVSNGLVSVAAKSEGAGGLLGKTAGLATGAAGAFGTMADVMGGPWGIAIGAGIGLLGGFAESMSQGVAQASDFTAAISQDGNAIGVNTEAVIANTIAKAGLAQVAQTAGISEQQLIEYASGDKTAQDAVTKALNAKQDALNQASNAEGIHSKAQFDTGNSADQEAGQLGNLKGRLDQVTNAVATALKEQTAQSQALNDAAKSANVFAASLGLAQQTLVTNADSTSVSAVAALNFGTNQSALNRQLYNSVDSYELATGAAGGYTSVLDAANGGMTTLLNTESNYTISLTTLSTSIAANGKSLDANNAKGAQNVYVATLAAQAAVKAAVAVYAQEQATQGATKAYEDANGKLETMKEDFIQTAEKAGIAKTAATALADELFKLPASVTTGLYVDTRNASAQISGLKQSILDNPALLIVNIKAQEVMSGPAHAYGGVIGAAATGGAQDGWTRINEQGQEIARLPTGAIVMPHANTESMLQAPAPSAPQGLQLTVGPGADGAVATMIMRLVREGKLQLATR